MSFDDVPAFRELECCQKLHLFNGRVHDLFADENALSKLLASASQFLKDCEAAEQAERDRQRRRITYFFDEAFASGKQHLRDETEELDGLSWSHYLNWANRMSDSHPDGIPEKVQRGMYYAWAQYPPHPSGFYCWAKRCYEPASGMISIHAWAPPDLAMDSPARNLQPQAPLPPKTLGRSYTIAEISWGLALLHDADGSYEPFVPDGHALYTSRWWIRKRALNDRDGITFHKSLLADDSWLPSLEPLLNRLIAELNGAAPGGVLEPPVDPFLNHIDLARHFRQSEEATRKKLDRWRRKHPALEGGWHEVSEPKPREPKYLYRLSAVSSLFEQGAA